MLWQVFPCSHRFLRVFAISHTCPGRWDKAVLFDASSSLTWQRLRSEVHLGGPPAKSQNVKTLEHLEAFVLTWGHVTWHVSTTIKVEQFRNVLNDFVSRWTLTARCLNHFMLLWSWTWYESTSNRWASSNQLVRLCSTEICTALLANGSSVQKKNTHARIPGLCRSMRFWYVMILDWAMLSWLSIQWATLVGRLYRSVESFDVILFSSSIAAVSVAGDKLSIRRNMQTEWPRHPEYEYAW